MPSMRRELRGLGLLLLVIFLSRLASGSDPELRRRKPNAESPASGEAPAKPRKKKRAKAETRPEAKPDDDDDESSASASPAPSPQPRALTALPSPAVPALRASAAVVPPAAPVRFTMLGRWRIGFDMSPVSSVLIEREDPDGSFHGSVSGQAHGRLDGHVEGDEFAATLRTKMLMLTIDTNMHGRIDRGAKPRAIGTWRSVAKGGTFSLEKD